MNLGDIKSIQVLVAQKSSQRFYDETVWLKDIEFNADDSGLTYNWSSLSLKFLHTIAKYIDSPDQVAKIVITDKEGSGWMFNIGRFDFQNEEKEKAENELKQLELLKQGFNVIKEILSMP